MTGRWLTLFFTNDRAYFYFLCLGGLTAWAWSIMKSPNAILVVNLFYLFTAFIAYQLSTFHRRFQSETYLFLSRFGTGRLVIEQYAASLPFALLHLLILFVLLCRANNDFPALLLVVQGSVAGFFAVSLGIFSGSLIRNRWWGLVLVFAFYLTSLQSMDELHELLFFVSPVVQLFHPYEWNWLNLFGLLSISLLLGTVTVIAYPRRENQRFLRWVYVGFAVLSSLILLVVVAFPFFRDHQIKHEPYQTVQVGHTLVEYKGITEEQAKTFGHLYESVQQEVQRVGLPTKRHTLRIVKSYSDGDWFSNDMPITREGDKLILRLYATKHLNLNYWGGGADWTSAFLEEILPPPKSVQREHPGYTDLQFWLKYRVVQHHSEIFDQYQRQRYITNFRYVLSRTPTRSRANLVKVLTQVHSGCSGVRNYWDLLRVHPDQLRSMGEKTLVGGICHDP
ncbi:hypothetical protein JQC72_03095 [Polycladomyces sp. WAk]|uniref:ABC transporter permease n=1 Tax=Polycladomyces zharkentensis TaxID=2807616 RepID=A0ABS2WGF2_9BACL|nr:hypothetical protein [Polycladomyces sp. WAk]MBN2908504.1 hypothetical protein [Polycladomyces sp. WAk]